MLADGLTKVLPRPALSDIRDKLHLVDVGPAPREPVIIQSPQARKPLDRMCVHAGDGQTYLSRLDSMS